MRLGRPRDGALMTGRLVMGVGMRRRYSEVGWLGRVDESVITVRQAVGRSRMCRYIPV